MSTTIENTSSAFLMEGRVHGRFLRPGESPAAVPADSGRGWLEGDCSLAALRMPIVAESLSAALAPTRATDVLDIGLTSGSIAISAGRRGARVVSITSQEPSDHAEAQRDQARERVYKEQLRVDFSRGNASALPFEDAVFDIVASSFSTMFEANSERVAEEMLRVCRPGGKIGLAAWTRDGFVGRLFDAIARHAPVQGIEAAFDWGRQDCLAALFGAQAETIETQTRTFVFRYDSARQWLDLWSAACGPLKRALHSIDDAARDLLEAELLTLVEHCNTATDGTLTLRADYLEVVITKQDPEIRGYVN